MRRKWDVSSDQVLKKCKEEIITRIKQQEGTEFGVIAAQDLIDIVLQNLAPDIYNLALADAKKIIQTKLSDLEVDLDLLENKN